MKSLRVLTLYVLSLLLIPFCLPAQSLTGVVLDNETNEPLIGANVRWLHQNDQGTITEVDGSFTLAVTDVQDSLVVSYLGFQSWQHKVEGSDQNLIIRLKPVTATAAQVLVVAERLPARVFATEQLKRLDVYLNPAAKADVLLAVNSLPAATNPDETANVSLRGSPYQATGIFLNNIPLYDAVRLDQPNGLGQFSIFNTSTVTSVDVYSSNPPLYLGQATSGAISIRTADEITGSQRAVNMHMAGGGAMLQQALGERTGLISYFNYGNHRLLKGANPSALDDIIGFTSFDAAVSLTHSISQRTEVSLFLLGIRERYGYQLASGRFKGRFDQEKDRLFSMINLRHQYKSWRFEWNQGFNWSEASYGFGNIATDLQQHDYHGNILSHWHKDQWNGTIGFYYTLRSQHVEGTFPLYNEAWESTDPFLAYQQKASINTPEIAGFAKRSLGKRSFLGIGTRIGRPHNASDLMWGAQIQWHYALDERHKLNAAIGRYYQQEWPRGESLATFHNYAYQFAVDWHYAHRRWQSQAAFYRHLNSWRGQDNPIYGAETLIRYQAYPLQLWVSASHVSSKIEQSESKYPSPYDFSYLIRAGLRWELPAQITVTGSWLLRQGQYYQPLLGREWEPAIDAFLPIYANPQFGERLPYFQRLDLGLSRIFVLKNSFIIAYFNVNNALNRANYRAFTFDNTYTQTSPSLYSQRTWFTGLVYQWE